MSRSDLRRGEDVRAKVIEALIAASRPLTAYQLLDQLRASGVSAPTTIYRALGRLASQGAVHRLETLNAFVACAHPGRCCSPAFAICRVCRAVTELENVGVAFREDTTSADNFAVERTTIEMLGLCARCRLNTNTAEVRR